MDSEYIEQLLQRYWQCQTSRDKERQLRDYFSRPADAVPEHLRRYRDLFAWQRQMSEARLSDSFDSRVLAEVEAMERKQAAAVVVKAGRRSIVHKLSPMFKAAAAIAVVLLVGNLTQRSLVSGGSDVMEITDSVGNQVSAPSVALGGSAGTDKTNDAVKQKSDSLPDIETMEKKSDNKRVE